jgi:hypothetical protein
LRARLLLASSLVLTFLALTHPAWAWSNGGYSADPNNPNYGTHDWIAERALDWLPANERALILTYRAAYLYGTELPDNNQAVDHIGDVTLHHVYYFANGSVQDDAAARRAGNMQDQVLAALSAQDYALAAKWTGAMTHYISDLAVFAHVMDTGTYWGEPVHHEDYEDRMQTRTDQPGETQIVIAFDGTLALVSPYDAALALARDTTFDLSGAGRTALWMDQHYNWSDPAFTARAYQSINLAVNYVAEAVHAIWSTYVVTTTTTSQQLTTSTTETHTTTTSTSYHTTTTAQSQETTWTSQTTRVESFGVGFGFAFIGIGAGVAAAALGVAVAVSGQSEVLAYGGYYYCSRHRVPVWFVAGRPWCPIERRYLRS